MRVAVYALMIIQPPYDSFNYQMAKMEYLVSKVHGFFVSFMPKHLKLEIIKVILINYNQFTYNQGWATLTMSLCVIDSGCLRQFYLLFVLDVIRSLLTPRSCFHMQMTFLFDYYDLLSR